MAKNEDFGIPLTQDCVFAVSLDTRKKKEHIIIGERNDIERYMNGFAHGDFIYSLSRDIGSLVMDFAPVIIADIRAALVDSTGRNVSPYFEREVSSLATLYKSGNPIYRFTALLMWQEYNRARHDKKAAERLYDAIDDITLALRFNMTDEVARLQEVDRENPLRYLDTDYRKFPVTLYYAADRRTSEWAVTDISPLAIAVYYLKRIYDSGKYIQTCPICGRAFVAKTAGMTTLCSDDCRRVQGTENKRRHDAKAKTISYERASKSAYMYWHNRIVKLRKMGLPGREMEKAERLFDKYTKESARRKKAVVRKEANATDFEAWLLAQRDVIDDFMDGVKKS